MLKRRGAALAAVLVLGACSSPRPDVTVEVGGAVFAVELADTAPEQKEGLAGRTEIPAGTGMLFSFGERAEHQMWMAGMEVPIDVAWIDGDRVIGLATLDPCTEVDQTTCPRTTAPGPATALLEVPAGALADVAVGDAVALREGSGASDVKVSPRPSDGSRQPHGAEHVTRLPR